MALATNLGTGWISITAETKGMRKDISAAMAGAQQEATSAGAGFGSKMSAGINKTLKAGVIGVGVAAGGVLAASITKGLGRLQGIDNAQAKLAGLGHEAQAVEGIMDDALASVKGTAFGLEDAATIAASAVAAGIKPGQDLQRTLKLTGDAATIAGTDMATMGSIVNKVATSDMMQMDVANQMMDAGIPILQMVGDELGVTAEEARKMASDGKVSFETFQSALEEGLGGAALKSGDTVQGAFANMGAAAGRFGAKLAEPIFNAAPAIFGSLGGAFDTLGEKLEPVIESFAESLAPRMENFAENTIPNLVDGVMGAVDAFIDFGGWVKNNADWIKPLAVGVGTVVAAVYAWNTATSIAKGVQAGFNVVLAANPIMLVVLAVAALAAGLVYFFTKTETGKKAWETFTTALADGWEWVAGKVGGGIEWLQEKLDAFTGWISTAWSGITSLFKGDFTADMRKAFGVEEDNPLVAGFLMAHDILTGIPKLIKGIGDILFKGDYTSLPFGLEEDSGFVAFLFGIRDAAIKTGEIIGQVWDGIVTVGKVAFAILGTVVLTPLMITWNALSEAFQWGWETKIRPAWEMMSSAATAMWEKAIKPALDAISEKWDQLQLAIAVAVAAVRLKLHEFQQAVTALWVEHVQPILDLISGKWNELSVAMAATWESIKTVVFDAWTSYVDTIKANWDLVTGALSSAWTGVKDTFIPIWETIRTAVFDAWNAYVDRVKSNWELVTGAINAAWDGTKNVLQVGWGWIRDNVFSKFNSAVDLMRSGAEIAMDGIGKAFDWLREKTAKPVNFVIETVYMDGIRKAWGAVASLVDLDDLPEVKPIGGFAQGGILPGYTPGRDPFTFIEPTTGMSIGLSGGEAIMRPEVTRAMGKDSIDHLNAVARSQGVDGVRRTLSIGHFSQGGIIDSMMGFVGKHFPALSMTSGWRFTDNGMHSRGQAADFSNQGSGGPSTPESRGLARAIFKNFPNQTEQLIHWREDGWKNLLSGRPFNYGAATNAQHTDHVHWGLLNPLNYDADELDLSGGGGGFFESITNMAKKLWDGIVSKVPSMPGADQMGKMGQLPAAWLKKVAGAAWEHVKGLADKLMPFGGSSGGGGEQWRGLASQALKRFGYGDEYLDAMVQQIGIESTGDPNAVNRWDSNWLKGTPSRGLLQVIDPTYRDVRNRYPAAFEGLPDDPTNPLTNLVAGVGAVKRDWGGPGGRWPTVDGYHNGGLAGLGQGWLKKTAIEPEMILNPEMTKAFIKWMDVAQDVAKAVEPTARDAGRGYLEAQATSTLDMFGLGGLVPLASTIGNRARDAYQASPYEVGFNGQSVTVEIEAESDADLIRVAEFKRLADQVHGLEVKVTEKKRPMAAAVTRGGAM